MKKDNSTNIHELEKERGKEPTRIELLNKMLELSEALHPLVLCVAGRPNRDSYTLVEFKLAIALMEEMAALSYILLGVRRPE
jgi:hypothetical protein